MTGKITRLRGVILAICVLWTGTAQGAATYVKKGSRVETIVASLKASGLPTLEGPWHYIGPFDNEGNRGFEAAFPPEREIDLKRTYPGKDGQKAEWKPFADFRLGQIVNLKKFSVSANCAIYLFHEIDAKEAVKLPISLGSDDSITVFLNGKRILADNAVRPAAPDQNQAVLDLQRGKNRLLLKIGNISGGWEVYVAPGLPEHWPAEVRKKFAQDYPTGQAAPTAFGSTEANHYRIETIPTLPDQVLEVGGLAFRADGKLLACTRRGEVWLLHNPGMKEGEQPRWTRFASGLHEALGLHVSGKDIYVLQRPELTKLIDRDGDDVVDEYQTVCDKWGISGDYHEFAFGPARDKQGNFYITLNVGFGGGHQAKCPWRGWCLKITPKGEMIPFATGLRSPNGINISPEGDLFYCDNQGEWVASNKMHHIREGDNFGHQAGLKWVPLSPFASKLKASYSSGMLYDGQKGTHPTGGLPPHDPPSIWFPYGRMGQSASEPIWDTTGGKFGPFAGQCFVGDLTRSIVMRVVLEKVNGRYQGACLPFRSGFQCGINRLVFGQQDGTLFVGQTNRGWGSLGGKPWGLQRLVYTGVLPFEIHAMKMTKTGFDLTFTKPLDVAAANRLQGYSLQSFTYNYWPNYGSPEVDRKAEKVQSVTVAKDGKSVSMQLNSFHPGRVYELHLDGIKATDGSSLLHNEAYYTVNEVVR